MRTQSRTLFRDHDVVSYFEMRPKQFFLLLAATHSNSCDLFGMSKSVNLFLVVIALFVECNGRTLFPNFYDTQLSVDDRTKMQEVHFRLAQGAAFRAYGVWRLWCYESWNVNGTAREIGRGYDFSDFRGLMITMVDLILLLQYDPQCEAPLLELRNLMLNFVFPVSHCKGYTYLLVLCKQARNEVELYR